MDRKRDPAPPPPSAVRLPAEEIAAIKQAVADVFGPLARVRLFGSRLDPARVGGDVDLLVHVPPGLETFALECRLARLLDAVAEGRKFDLVLLADDRTPNAFEAQAVREGVLL